MNLKLKKYNKATEKQCVLCNNSKGLRKYWVFLEGYNQRHRVCLPCLIQLKEKGKDIQQTVKEKIKELTAVKT